MSHQSGILYSLIFSQVICITSWTNFEDNENKDSPIDSNYDSLNSSILVSSQSTSAIPCNLVTPGFFKLLGRPLQTRFDRNSWCGVGWSGLEWLIWFPLERICIYWACALWKWKEWIARSTDLVVTIQEKLYTILSWRVWEIHWELSNRIFSQRSIFRDWPNNKEKAKLQTFI